jgi:hypothetical protein
MRALLHAHSDWSYDGDSSLASLARWGEARGLHAILLTEHVNDFDLEKMERYVDEVEALRDRPCRLVPGLEFAVRGGFHILAFNMRQWTRSVEPLATVRFIRERGGIAVLAHPARYGGRWPADEVLRELHGIEVWNARYDGRFVPPGSVIEASHAVCARFDHLRFFGGQDLHGESSQRLVASLTPGKDGVEGLVGSLLHGEATFGAPGFRVPARPEATAKAARVMMKLGERCYVKARDWRNRWFR